MSLGEAITVLSELKKMNYEECLTLMLERYKNTDVDKMLADIIMQAEKHFLTMHNHPITKGSDGRYWTRIDTPEEAKRSKQVVRKKKKDLENFIIRHYMGLSTRHTISSFYNEYLNDRKNFVSNATVERDRMSIIRLFKGTELSDKEISKITRSELTDFNIEMIIKHQLNKKGFCILKTLENQLWDFAIEKGWTESNLPRHLKSISRIFFIDDGSLDVDTIRLKYPELTKKYDWDNNLKTNSEEDETSQFYLASEENALIKVCMNRYLEDKNTAYLAIILNFFLGLRVGELVALKPSDFDLENNVVKIRRREVADIDPLTGKKIFRISPRLKNRSSKRSIPLSPMCRIVFEMIVEDNRQRRLYSEFLFNSFETGTRMPSNCVRTALVRANKAAHLKQRSVHKIRKTVLSRLEMTQNFTTTRIREIAGHSPQSIVLYTTYFHTITDLDGITECESYSEAVECMVDDVFSENAVAEPPGSNMIPEIIPFRRIG